MEANGEQTNTRQAFYDKWHEMPDLAFRQTNTEGSDIQTWILERNGFADQAAAREYLSDRKRLLDAGCGNGRVTALLHSLAPPSATIVGVDLTAADVAAKNLEGLPNIDIHPGNLREDLAFLGTFDFVYCQEVLHHTGDAAGAFANLATLLEPGGELAIYVYREKAPIREFADDLLRERMAALSHDESMEVSRRITEIGRALSDLDRTIEVPEIAELGIEAGTYDVQRFVYHFLIKCFWSEELGFEGSAGVNYDWYKPEDCTRHTLDEVLGWFADARLDVVHEHVDPYGITVRGVRPG